MYLLPPRRLTCGRRGALAVKGCPAVSSPGVLLRPQRGLSRTTSPGACPGGDRCRRRWAGWGGRTHYLLARVAVASRKLVLMGIRRRTPCRFGTFTPETPSAPGRSRPPWWPPPRQARIVQRRSRWPPLRPGREGSTFLTRRPPARLSPSRAATCGGPTMPTAFTPSTQAMMRTRCRRSRLSAIPPERFSWTPPWRAPRFGLEWAV